MQYAFFNILRHIYNQLKYAKSIYSTKLTHFYQFIVKDEYFLLLSILQIYNFILDMLTNQTPFEYIQRRDKQRKNNILSSIQKKDLKRRSISYNFHSNNDQYLENAQLDENDQAKDHISHITINNSIKKSYYYRKMMNKSIQSHLTSEEFQRVKEKFDRINSKDTAKDNKSLLFRQIWQKEQFKKYANGSPREQQNYLEVVAKNTEKYKTLALQTESHLKKKEETPKSILDIASQRRTTFNFDLQILGNKKSIRIKDHHNKIKNHTTANTKTMSTSERDDKDIIVKIDQNQPSSLKIEKEESLTKAPCTFFKRFQQQNSQQKIDRNNQFLQITKLNQPFFPSSNHYQIQDLKLKKIKLKQYQSSIQQSHNEIIRREIQSSWRPMTRASAQKPYKIQSSHNRRTQLLKHKRVQLSNFTNDIEGWMVKPQNDDELLGNLQE